jgi:hypothetical protein
MIILLNARLVTLTVPGCEVADEHVCAVRCHDATGGDMRTVLGER